MLCNAQWNIKPKTSISLKFKWQYSEKLTEWFVWKHWKIKTSKNLHLGLQKQKSIKTEFKN